MTIQPGPYPTERGIRAIAGLPADRASFVAAYGEAAQQQFNQMGTVLAAKMPLNDPQAIADGVLSLVNMAPGTRPLRLPLDAVADGADQEFIDARASLKAKLLAKYFTA